MALLWKQLRYSLYLIFHPFDGFWDLKHEKRGSRLSAIAIIGILVLTSIIKTQFTGYLYNQYYDGVSLNILSEFTTTVGTFLLWCIANWALTTLMDGEGTFGDIVMVSAYALTPMILIGVPMAFLSNFMPLEFGTFYTLANGIAVVWSGFLMLSGLLVVHQYTLGKTVLTAILIIVAMAVIIFLGLLFFNLISQLIGFFIGMYREIVLRIL
ncbi:MAG TPA: YIP1 family protein [Clostridiales bacterium]|jgi:hypothetical protein|nr:YIP1 family protein [Clostridiales bacterium]